MNILDLSEKEIKEVKNRLIDDGLIVEKNKIVKYDEKFFEVVTTAKRVVKILLFVSLALYIALNAFSIAMSAYYKTFNLVRLIAPVAVCVAVLVLTFAIFGNVNVDKRKEENVLYVIGDNFVFNFSDGVTYTPRLFYSLSFESITKIEFVIDRLRKSQLFGSITFYFEASDCEVTHTILTANLSQIEQFLKTNFPTLSDKLIVDGRDKDGILVNNVSKGKYIAVSLVLAAAATLSFVLPCVFDADFITFKALGVILAVTSIAVFVMSFICLYRSVRGLMISAAFIASGYLVPLAVFELDGSPVLKFLANGNLILLPTFFGNIGLCLYISVLAQIVGKIIYKVKIKRNG